MDRIEEFSDDISSFMAEQKDGDDWSSADLAKFLLDLGYSMPAKPVPIPQELRNPYADKGTLDILHDHNVWNECAIAFRPLLEQAERKLEEVCADNLQRGNRISVLEQQIVDLNESQDDLEQKIAALESQLKGAVELDENQKIPMYSEKYRLTPAGNVRKNFNYNDYSMRYRFEKQIREYLRKAGFRKVKALASTEKTLTSPLSKGQER